MRVLIIGASRGLGFELVHHALEQNHHVTAFARTPDSLEVRHDRLTIVKGDVLDSNSVQQVMENQEAVFTCVGTKFTFSPVTLFSEGMKNVLAAMNAKGVKRLVAITGIGAGDSRGHGGFLFDRLFQPTLVKTIYEDKDREEELIKESTVDWTIVRPGMLTKDELKGNYQVFTDLTGVTAGYISRYEVSDFMLAQLTSTDYLKKTPLICRLAT
ncbi:MAG: SDR family oxidoreductase [Chlorobiales bacterium]|nr:SDR family oxidoreductase [Chlorobiales bacterium]